MPGLSLRTAFDSACYRELNARSESALSRTRTFSRIAREVQKDSPEMVQCCRAASGSALASVLVLVLDLRICNDTAVRGAIGLVVAS